MLDLLLAAILVQADAQALLDAGKLPEAAAAARQYVLGHADSADAHCLLGYILYREGNHKASLSEYVEGAKLRAPTAIELAIAGIDSFLMEDYAAADQRLSNSVELDPNDPRTLYYLGRTKYNEKHFDEAVRAFADCLKLEPSNVKAADNLGLAYQRLGKTEEALAAYRAAIKAPTQSMDAYLDLGTLLVENSRAGEAVPFLTQAIAIDENDPRPHRELGKAYLDSNRIEEAQSEIE